MDHSVQGYLERLSTQELEGALQYYLRADKIGDHYSAVLSIINELKRRFVPDEMTPQELEALERYKRRIQESHHL